MNKKNFEGTITAIVTPFTQKGDVDFNSLEKLIDFQIENKTDGIVVCASTGESSTLKFKEKQAIIVHSVEYSAGRIPIIAYTGTNETESSRDLTFYAKEQGANAALVVAPYYNKPTQDGLFEHFRLIAEQVNIPTILYNIPSRTGVNINAETQLKLAETCSNIVAVKEASANLEQMMEVVRNAPKHFHLLAGDDYLTLPILSIGGRGVVSVISNYIPKQFSEMVNLALEGKFAKADEIHYKYLNMMKLNYIEASPAPVKYILSAMGFIKDTVRMPMLPLKPENKKKIKDELKELGIINK